MHLIFSTEEISLPTSPPTTIPLQHTHHVTHDHTSTLGHASSEHSASNELICTTKYSGQSQVGDDQTAEVKCDAGDVMTGCSSVTLVRGLW